MAKADLTAARLRDVLDYDPDTGVFAWRKRSDTSRMAAGSAAGTLSNDRRSIWVDMRSYQASRLAWLHVYGEWPKRKLIYLNGDTLDCRIQNLAQTRAPLRDGIQQELTRERLKSVLTYEPETGAFSWVQDIGARARAGAPAGAVCQTHGYVNIGIDGVTYKAHRLAWLYVHGEWPPEHIDHINGCRADNRLCNLRAVSHAVNMQNIRGARATSTSGLLGVTPSGSKRNPWRAAIGVNGKNLYLGHFKTAEAAHAVALAAKRELHEGCTI